jgi:hypothetical protein
MVKELGGDGAHLPVLREQQQTSLMGHLAQHGNR